MYAEFFDEFSYFCGFYWGDGSSQKSLKMQIVKRDGRVLKKVFEQFLRFKYREYKPSQEGAFLRQEVSYFSGFEKELSLFLMENDYHSKSFIAPTKILKLINPKYFWQGLVDADGCFYKKKTNGGSFTLTSTIDQDWSEAIAWLESLGVFNISIYKKNYKHSKCSVLSIRYSEDIKKIGDYLYSDKIIGLKRKFKKFQSIKNSLPTLTSTIKGVSFCKKKNLWRAYKNRTHLGWFKTEEAAILARSRS